MELFDQLISEVTKTAGMQGAEHSQLLGGVLETLDQSPGGGLDELVSSFQKAGLGHIAESWISTGPNVAVTPQQVARGFGEQRISSLAQRFGMSPQMVSMALTVLLPILIDKLTPHGQVPKPAPDGTCGLAGLVQGALGGLGGLFGGR